jgi:hypothetical protein
VTQVDLVGMSVEVVAAERLQPGEPLVDLGLLSDEGIQSGISIAAGFLGAGW